MAERSYRVEVDGLKLAVAEWGPADAPPLVLLHGLTSDLHAWDRWGERWAPEFRVIAYDQRGHGESEHAVPGGFEAYNVRQLVADLDGLVRALELPRFSVLGMSMGGRPVLAYATRRPEIVDAAVVVDIGPEMDRTGGRSVRDGVKAQVGTPSASEAPAAPAAPVPYDPTLLELMGRKSLTEIDFLWDAVRALTCPTLVVRGEHSTILSAAIAQRMTDELPDGELVTVAGAGHAVPTDRPDEFEHAVLTFLRRRSGGHDGSDARHHRTADPGGGSRPSTTTSSKEKK
jgi:pimeloyl-ACP methyl ester carboxylesterase